jgi:hypothetical protein
MTLKNAAISWAFVATLTFSIFGPVKAQEVCAPVLVLPAIIHTPAYDPFAQSPLVEDTAIGFSGANCQVPIAVSADIGWGSAQPRLTHNGRQLSFKMLLAGVDLSTNASPSVNITSSLNGARIALPNGIAGSLSQQTRLFIPEGQVVPPGVYMLSVPSLAQNGIGLLTQTEGTNEVRSSPITLSTQVLAVMKLRVTGCDLSSDGISQSTNLSQSDLASACTLNLGDPALGMSNGNSRQARINTQANVNFKVSMVSTNGGIMRLSGRQNEDRETEKIRYVAALEGAGQNSVYTCSASNCGSSDLFEPSASQLGTDMYFHVRINDPDISQKRAGIYSDTITLIVQPAS